MDSLGDLGRFNFVATEVEAVLHMRFAGELDSAAVDEVREALREPLAGDHTVIVDLSGVSFMDSAGLKLMVDAKRFVESQGGRLLISRLSPAVERLLALVQLERWFEQASRGVL